MTKTLPSASFLGDLVGYGARPGVSWWTQLLWRSGRSSPTLCARGSRAPSYRRGSSGGSSMPGSLSSAPIKPVLRTGLCLARLPGAKSARSMRSWPSSWLKCFAQIAARRFQRHDGNMPQPQASASGSEADLRRSASLCECKIMPLVLHSRGPLIGLSRPLSLPKRHGTDAAISVRQIGNISGLRFLPWAND